MTESTPTITHNEAKTQFEASSNGETAFLDYIETEENFVIAHTEVPPNLEGNGIGSALVHEAIDYAQGKELPVIPVCPFARTVVQKGRGEDEST